MSHLERRTARLIAVGASVAANCQSCLKMMAAKARQEEIKEKEIVEAVEIGKLVRRCAASQMDEFAASVVVVWPSVHPGRRETASAKSDRRKNELHNRRARQVPV